MTNATFIFRHSRKLKNAPSILRNEPAILARWFSKEAFSSNKGDDLLKIRQQGKLRESKDGGFVGGNVRTFSCSANNLDISTISRTTRMGNSLTGTVFSSGYSCSKESLRRGFSSDSGLPPHQETDKATVEMEYMEEGYLAKIIHGDVANNIQVGEAIAITVEEEEDIANFKDYKPSSSDSADAVKSSEPAPPKKEVVEPVSSPEPKVSKIDQAPSQSRDRLFASLLARKLAEDNNVPDSSVEGTGSDGSSVEADIAFAEACHNTEIIYAYSDGGLWCTNIDALKDRAEISAQYSWILMDKDHLPILWLTLPWSTFRSSVLNFPDSVIRGDVKHSLSSQYDVEKGAEVLLMELQAKLDSLRVMIDGFKNLKRVIDVTDCRSIYNMIYNIEEKEDLYKAIKRRSISLGMNKMLSEFRKLIDYTPIAYELFDVPRYANQTADALCKLRSGELKDFDITLSKEFRKFLRKDARLYKKFITPRLGRRIVRGSSIGRSHSRRCKSPDDHYQRVPETQDSARAPDASHPAA